MKYFLYLCNEASDFEIAKSKGGESPPARTMGFKISVLRDT